MAGRGLVDDLRGQVRRAVAQNAAALNRLTGGERLSLEARGGGGTWPRRSRSFQGSAVDDSLKPLPAPVE
jgi:hypothetical protein